MCSSPLTIMIALSTSLVLGVQNRTPEMSSPGPDGEKLTSLNLLALLLLMLPNMNSTFITVGAQWGGQVHAMVWPRCNHGLRKSRSQKSTTEKVRVYTAQFFPQAPMHGSNFTSYSSWQVKRNQPSARVRVCKWQGRDPGSPVMLFLL